MVNTVSIITPSYNQGQFLEETIKSVICQEGDFLIDYIIMDGGSTDNSTEIIKKYDNLLKNGNWPIQCRGIKYRWTSEKDKGQTDAVNKGFALAEGEFLGWLNSDDTYLPRAVMKAVDYFSTHPDDVMVYGNAYLTNKDSVVTSSYPSKYFSLKKLAGSCYICQPAVFMRAAAVNEVGELDANLQTCMDYDLWIRMGKRFEGKIAFIKDYLATSRMYGENKSLSMRDKVYEECISTVRKHFGYVDARWIISCILDVFRENHKQSLPRLIRKLGSRLFTLRYFLQLRTIKSLYSLFKSMLLDRKESESI